MPVLLPLAQTNTSVHASAHTRTHYHKKNCNRILQLFHWLPSLSHTQLRALIHDKLSHLIHDKSSEGQIDMRKLREKRRRGRASGKRERDVREKERRISGSLEGSPETEGRKTEGVWALKKKHCFRHEINVKAQLYQTTLDNCTTYNETLCTSFTYCNCTQ